VAEKKRSKEKRSKEKAGPSELGMTIKIKGKGQESAAERFLSTFGMTVKSKRS
jgi:hypothetical protein